MTNKSAYSTMCRTLAAAAFLGTANFLYVLWVCGASSGGVTFALGTTLFVFAMSIWAAVTVFLE